MAIRTIITRGFGNGTFTGTIADIITRGYTIGAQILSIPSSLRTYLIDPENRTHEIAAENRDLIIPAEDRGLDIAPDRRTLNIPSENREIMA